MNTYSQVFKLLADNIYLIVVFSLTFLDTDLSQIDLSYTWVIYTARGGRWLVASF